MHAAEPQGTFPLHLLRLVSASLPVGTFSYSRGLESAVEAGWVADEAAARDWILGTLEHSFAPLDGALFCRMMAALAANDTERLLACDAWLAAARESLELQQEDRRMAEALLTLLADLEVPDAAPLKGGLRCYASAFALAARHWQVPEQAALEGLMWTVVDGQVAASLRLIRMGQTAGQRILIAAIPVIERSAAAAARTADDDVGNVSVAMAMASARHETQYSRLFRS